MLDLLVHGPRGPGLYSGQELFSSVGTALFLLGTVRSPAQPTSSRTKAQGVTMRKVGDVSHCGGHPFQVRRMRPQIKFTVQYQHCAGGHLEA